MTKRVKRTWIIAALAAFLCSFLMAGCGQASKVPENTPELQQEESVPIESGEAPVEEPPTLVVELKKSSMGVNSKLGYMFYDLAISSKYWWGLSNDERDALARELVAEYDAIGLEAGYDEKHSVVTAWAANDFAFGEEDTGDGRDITVFDNKTANSARRIVFQKQSMAETVPPSAPEPVETPQTTSPATSGAASSANSAPQEQKPDSTPAPENSQLEFFDGLSDDPSTTPTEKVAGVAYWTEGGKSYHFSENCVTLKRSKKIISGTLEQALAAGKKDPCNICAGGK